MKKEISTEELKLIELDILKQFHKICTENNLRYSISGGTLLGAVRHGGYIPWDDDIDVCMPREDYERLLKLKYDDGDYEIKSYRYSKSYYYIFSKMVDKRTVIEETSRAEKDMGVYIDIFPTDYVYEGGEELNSLLKKAQKNKNIIDHLGSNLSYNKSFSPKYIAKLAARLAISPFQKAIFRSIEKKMSALPYKEKSANVVYNIYERRELFDTKLYDDLVLIDFEDSKFLSFRDYNSYLTDHFGNYMQLPPEKDRVAHHNFTAYRK